MSHKECYKCARKIVFNKKLTGYTFSLKPTQMHRNPWHKAVTLLANNDFNYAIAFTTRCPSCTLYRTLARSFFALWLNRLEVIL